jgi:phi13 family phage major tail protein
MPTTNKVKFNLKNVHYAKMTVNTQGVITYATPVHIPGAVSVSFDPQGESSPFYADGIVYYRSTNNNGYSGTLEMALIPDSFRKDILQETEDAKGVLAEDATEREQVHFALLFEFDGDKKTTRHAMLNCTANRMNISSSTKEETITPVTESLTINCDPRESDMLVKYSTGDGVDEEVYNSWYSAVYVPAASANTGANTGTGN